MADNNDGTPEGGAGTGKTFTQAEVDTIVADRLKREQNKFKDYDDLKTKAGKFDDLEKTSKTETQQLSDRLTAAEQKVADAEARAMRSEVAARKKLTPGQAKRLVGSTIEELESDADDILTEFKPAASESTETDPGKPGKTTPATRPTENLRPGNRDGGTSEPEETDPRKLAAAIPRR